MHEDIQKFTREGYLKDDCNLWRTKELMVRDLEDEMRASGYIVVLDLNPHWTPSFNYEKERYDFKLTMYGVYVGGDDLSTTVGYSDGKLIQVR